MSETDTEIVIEPEGKATACVIWLHGLGADGHDFEPIVPELNLPSGHGIRFLFPHAPYMPVTINQGYVMRAWYDILSMEIAAEQDEAVIRQSASMLESLIEEQCAQGISPERIVLAGFSQGGAIALHTALRYEKRIAGILALSTYLPLVERFDSERSDANRETPVFIGHGTQDPIVPHSLGVQTRRVLKDLDYKVEWHEYPMAHSVCMEEIRDIGRWLEQRLDES
ncbi:MAG: alpha/beta fold hydrolase [Gammaproteobacteria bacterium]|nr:alpha/beta fold hydrolase [Gammaproteobacteria bacterium]